LIRSVFERLPTGICCSSWGGRYFSGATSRSAARLPAPTLTAPAAIASVATTTSSIVAWSGPPLLWARLVHGEASSIELGSV
jgi:hypothetical protein